MVSTRSEGRKGESGVRSGEEREREWGIVGKKGREWGIVGEERERVGDSGEERERVGDSGG